MTSQPSIAPFSVKIAVLSDIHYGEPSAIKKRRTDIADILLLRAVHRLNRYIHPDVTVVLGDILDTGSSPDASEQRNYLKSILDKLESEIIVLPGNHDGDVEAFYANFTRPESIVNIAGIRFIPFVDAEAPGYNATRSDRDLNRFAQARHDYDGPIIALQHVCLYPPERGEIPYNYTNAQAIIEMMQRYGVSLSLSGHYHAGAETIVENGIHYVNAPGLCEKPFRFMVIHIENGHIHSEPHQLAIPEVYHLVDRHVHTQLAYCQQNMTVEKAIAFAEDFGLAGIGFSEHSGQLYFPREGYWGGEGYRTGMHGARPEDNRMRDYQELRSNFTRDNVRFGLEVDIDYRGRLLLNGPYDQPFDYLLGAVHSTPNIKNPDASHAEIETEFMNLMARLLAHNIDVVVHPFRVFKRAGLSAPEYLFTPVAELLARHGTAAEINFHSNNPPALFIQACLQRGVKFSLGSDAHNLYEVGEFAPHLALLREVGFDGDVRDILIPRTVGGFV